MDGLKIIEGLDSLWFFTKILSSTPLPLGSASDGYQSAISESHPKDITSKEKPITPILQNQQDHSPIDVIVVQSHTQSGNLLVEIEEEKKDKDEEEIRGKRKSKRRIKSGLDQRRKMLMELHFGFDVNEISGFWMVEKTKFGYERFGGQHHHVKMPPISDGMAMKEHLKSWAYAVACTVR